MRCLKKTNTKIAPWSIISADRKIDARIDAINLILKNISYDKSTQIHSKEINFKLYISDKTHQFIRLIN